MRTIKLRSGGEVTLAYRGNLFEQSREDRAFLVTLTEALDVYEAGDPVGSPANPIAQEPSLAEERAVFPPPHAEFKRIDDELTGNLRFEYRTGDGRGLGTVITRETFHDDPMLVELIDRWFRNAVTRAELPLIADGQLVFTSPSEADIEVLRQERAREEARMNEEHALADLHGAPATPSATSALVGWDRSRPMGHVTRY